MYAIVDIETTGGSPQNEKITEIAILVHDGEKITDEFVTLINPEKTIPYYITGLTGITNEMVSEAPKFFEIARKIIDLTENKIFVAHNVNFDYNFIRSEFMSLGYKFQRKLLCTVKLSRKLIPGKKSYSLGNICNEMGINIHSRHRAAGDAFATVKLFEILLQLKNQNGSSGIEENDLGVLHPALDKQKVFQLPEDPGVYFLYNDMQEIIYIGKSKNIKSRVLTHLGSTKNSTSQKMRKEIADVSFELTGNELVALLMESEEIKKHQPLFNRTQRRTLRNYGIFDYYNPEGFLCFKIDEINSKISPAVSVFNSPEYAQSLLIKLIEKYNLCQKLCGLYNSQGHCFHYEIRLCKGACAGIELPEEYNQRALMALSSIANKNESLLIIDKGRNMEEKSVVRIENGKYLGYGFIDIFSVNGIESLSECIMPRKDNYEIYQIIKTYLRKNKVERIIK